MNFPYYIKSYCEHLKVFVFFPNYSQILCTHVHTHTRAIKVVIYLEDSLEEGMATHSSILVWRIPWTEEPGGLQFMKLQRAGHDWSDSACMHAHTHTRYLSTLYFPLVPPTFSLPFGKPKFGPNICELVLFCKCIFLAPHKAVQSDVTLLPSLSTLGWAF